MQIKPRHLIALLLIAGGLTFKALQREAPATDKHKAGPAAQGKTNTLAPDQLQLGQLQLLPCEIGNPEQPTLQAYCAEFPVAENPDAPAGRQIKLKVAVVRSEAAQADADLVTFLDGGPGGAATEDFPGVASAFAPLLRQHHVLLIDQRGTGSSNPLDCPVLTQREQQRRESSGEAADALITDGARTRAVLRECVDEVSKLADANFYTTTHAVNDLEAVRRALGSPQLNLVGVSYGTRVAQQYARRYAQAVRSIVLDSAVPNAIALGQDQAANLEAALKAQLDECNRQPVCQQRFGDVYARLIALRDRLRSQPVKTQVADPNTFITHERTLTANSLAGLVRLYAYNSNTSALLPLMIDEASKGNYAPLLGQAQLLSDDLEGRFNGGMGLSVICTEDADLLQARDMDRDTLLGNSLIEFYQQACAVWPHQQRPADFHQPLQSAIPTLILAGEYDPVTPPRYADAIKATLKQARVLLAPGQGHPVLNVRCMPQLLEKFIRDLQPEALDASCLQQLRATPAFLTYNGAAP